MWKTDEKGPSLDGLHMQLKQWKVLPLGPKFYQILAVVFLLFHDSYEAAWLSLQPCLAWLRNVRAWVEDLPSSS